MLKFLIALAVLCRCVFFPPFFIILFINLLLFNLHKNEKKRARQGKQGQTLYKHVNGAKNSVRLSQEKVCISDVKIQDAVYYLLL